MDSWSSTNVSMFKKSFKVILIFFCASPISLSYCVWSFSLDLVSFYCDLLSCCILFPKCSWLPIYFMTWTVFVIVVIFIFIFTDAYMYVCMLAILYKYIHIYAYTYTYTYIYIYIYMFYIYIYINTHIYIYIYMCVYV